MSDFIYPGMSAVGVYLHYADVGEALSWLAVHYGFRETLRVPIANGQIAHAEMRIGDSIIMMGCPGPDYCDGGDTGLQSMSVVVYLPDVEAHHATAAAAGATILSDLHRTPYGDLAYRTRDYAGHLWTFATHVETVDPATWGAIVRLD